MKRNIYIGKGNTEGGLGHNSLYNVAGRNVQEKVLKRFSMFDGVGYDLTSCETYDEALDAAGLDYTAEKKELFIQEEKIIPTRTVDGIEDVVSMPSYTPVKGTYAFVKSDEPTRILGIMGNQYTPVGNRDAFAVAEDIVEEGLARYEVGGPSLGAKKTVDYGKSFLVLRGDDFKIGDDEFNSFTYFNNSFDGSSGVQYSTVCQRLACLNGMIRFMAGAKSQFRISIQHSSSALERIEQAKKIVMQRQDDIQEIKRQAELLIGTEYTQQEFEKFVIPQILKEMKLVEKDKERQRGAERVERVVDQLMQAWHADDVQNYAGSAYRVLLALSDFESHAEPLKNTGNGHLYLNRITKGMALTTAALAVVDAQKHVGIFKR